MNRKKIKKFIRAKTICCGKTGYTEIDIIPRTELQEITVKSKRSRKWIKESQRKQKNLNEKNSRRYLLQLVNGNFTENDYHASATYKDGFLPETVEEAEKEVANLIKRIKYRLKKDGLGELKFVLVTEYNFAEDNQDKPVRIHHHIIMSCKLNRDILEDLWSRRKRKGQKKGERLGTINIDRLQLDENGLKDLCSYITKSKKSTKRWSSSRNLIRPLIRKNDTKFSKRKLVELCKNPNIKEEIQKIYPKMKIVSVEPKYFNETGWHIYVKGWSMKKE